MLLKPDWRTRVQWNTIMEHALCFHVTINNTCNTPSSHEICMSVWIVCKHGPKYPMITLGISIWTSQERLPSKYCGYYHTHELCSRTSDLGCNTIVSKHGYQSDGWELSATPCIMGVTSKILHPWFGPGLSLGHLVRTIGP